MYKKLSQETSVTRFKDIWKAKMPLKIKIFSWHLVLDKLHCTIQVAIRHSPSNGTCALCGFPEDAACTLWGFPEDASHMFFRCSLAKFVGSAFRQILGCNWCPTNFTQFHAILSSFVGYTHRLLWMFFLAHCWHIRNNLTIERKIINHPGDGIYNNVLFL
jgi:hypothetical protein